MQVQTFVVAVVVAVVFATQVITRMSQFALCGKWPIAGVVVVVLYTYTHAHTNTPRIHTHTYICTYVDT